MYTLLSLARTSLQKNLKVKVATTYVFMPHVQDTVM